MIKHASSKSHVQYEIITYIVEPIPVSYTSMDITFWYPRRNHGR